MIHKNNLELQTSITSKTNASHKMRNTSITECIEIGEMTVIKKIVYDEDLPRHDMQREVKTIASTLVDIDGKKTLSKKNVDSQKKKYISVPTLTDSSDLFTSELEKVLRAGNATDDVVSEQETGAVKSAPTETEDFKNRCQMSASDKNNSNDSRVENETDRDSNVVTSMDVDEASTIEDQNVIELE